MAAVQLPQVSDVEFNASITELRELAKTLGFAVVQTFIQKRSSFDTTAYLGVGKREEISCFINSQVGVDDAEASMSEDNHFIDLLLVDHEISPSQARNLEVQVGCEVMDRTMIFAKFLKPSVPLQAAFAKWTAIAPKSAA